MSQPRHFQNNLERTEKLSGQEPVVTVLPSLTQALKVLQKAVATGEGLRGPSVYTGLPGIAFVYLHVHQVLLRNAALAKQLGHQDPIWAEGAAGFLEAAAAILEATAPVACSLHSRHPRMTFLEGYPGVIALQAVCYHHRGKQREALQAAQVLETMASSVTECPEGECEVLYGRAGYLYALCFVQKHLGSEAISSAILETICLQILQEGAANVDMDASLRSWGLMYQWHYKQYLGGCHGIAGILYTLLLSGSALERVITAGDYRTRLQAAASSLLDACFPSGNLPPSLGGRQDTLVQWCHGAPGLTQLLAEMCQSRWQPLFGDELQARARATAERAGNTIWERGLLTKGLGLCHGISGNAYALSAAARAGDDQQMHHSALQFGLFMAEHWEKLYPLPDHPSSLFEGLGGAVCFWMDILDDINQAHFPGFEL
ncbi:hypothetical protein WJX74_004162 [Apatococcus lobatus]|uniref:LanC-like protein 2 n=1 Tax=Apatococcus lobatus TaxID=904363 RepID=A0AAW1S2Y2_9CHLO